MISHFGWFDVGFGISTLGLSESESFIGYMYGEFIEGRVIVTDNGPHNMFAVII